MTENPWPAGSPQAEEWDAIAARLRDPQRERRAARFVEDDAAARRGVLPQYLPVSEHAARLEQLSTVGVLFGPDCSQFQNRPAWGAVRSAGCLIGGYKVSEGYSYTDPSHAYNRTAVPAAGLVPLAYHYLVDTSTPESQADHYCGLADPNAIHALDVEAASSGGLQVARWVAAYRKHYPSKALLIYTNHGMWTARSHVTDRWPAGVQSWHAGIGDGYYTPAKGGIAAEYAATGSLRDSTAQLGAPAAKLWQITDHAAVPGVAGTCDGNAFLGTLADLQALATGAADDMSQADVDAVLKGLDDRIDKIAAAVGNRTSYNDKDPYHPEQPLTFDRILNEVYRGVGSLKQTAGRIDTQTDTLEASAAAEAAADAALQAGVDSLNAKLGSGGGGQLTKADLLEALGAVRLTTDPPA